jgi:hypothetical protein
MPVPSGTLLRYRLPVVYQDEKGEKRTAQTLGMGCYYPVAFRRGIDCRTATGREDQSSGITC